MRTPSLHPATAQGTEHRARLTAAEQEREIAALRRENEANKQSARTMLDVLVVVCFFM